MEEKRSRTPLDLESTEYDVAVVHDDEPGIITLAPQSSGWANPSQLMASL